MPYAAGHIIQDMVYKYFTLENGVLHDSSFVCTCVLSLTE